MQKLRLLSILTAGCLLFCGCQPTQSQEAAQQGMDVQNASEMNHISPEDDTLSTVAKCEKLDIMEGIDTHCFTQTADGLCCFGSGHDRTVSVYCFANDFSGVTDHVLIPPAEIDGFYYMDGLYVFGEDVIYSIALMQNHSNMVPPSYDASVDTYDFDTYYSTWESSYLLCTYAMDGTLASAVPITGLEPYADDNGDVRLSQLYYETDGSLYVLLDDDIVVLQIKLDGTVRECCKFPELDNADYVRIVKDRDGKLLLSWQSLYRSNPDDIWVDQFTLKEFDINNGLLGDTFYVMDNARDIMGEISAGSGEYRCYMPATAAVYGIRDDGTEEMLIDWRASDMPAIDVFPLEDGSFIGSYYGENGEEMYHITRKYTSQIVNVPVVTVCRIGVFDKVEEDFIKSFNRSHDNFRVEIVDTMNADDSDSDEAMISTRDEEKQFNLDIMSGKATDIVFIGAQDAMTLGKHGAFCNLYELMENDPDVNRSTVLPNLLTALETQDGALYSLPRSFDVYTLITKSKYNTSENWTLQDMLSLYEDGPETEYQWEPRSYMLNLLVQGMDFIDEKKGTCSFDTPDFISMLEFCKRFPESCDEPEKDYENSAAMDAYNQYIHDRFQRYHRDEDVMSTLFLQLDHYSYARYAQMGDEITMVGYPTSNGNGGKLFLHGDTMGITSSCKNKEYAWEFIKAWLKEDKSHLYMDGYSIFEEQFEETLDTGMVSEASQGFYEDDGYKIYPLTQAERDHLEHYIRSCDTLLQSDADIINIVTEEAEMYFSGDQTAQQAADRIQGRASILVSERS